MGRVLAWAFPAALAAISCEFHDWSDWGLCHIRCKAGNVSVGHRIRSRVPKECDLAGAESVNASIEELEPCNMTSAHHHAPCNTQGAENCSFGEWTDHAACLLPQNLSRWSNWSEYTVEQSIGVKRHRREVTPARGTGRDCDGPSMALMECEGVIATEYAPAHGSVAPMCDGTIRVTFSEPVEFARTGSVVSLVSNSTDDVMQIPMAPPAAYVKGNHVAIRVASCLLGGELYHVRFQNHSIVGLHSNETWFVDGSSRYNFTTEPSGWLAGDWGACSVECGGGVRGRYVVCIAANGSQAQNKSVCEDEPPPTSVDCHSTTCESRNCTDDMTCTIRSELAMHVASMDQDQLRVAASQLGKAEAKESVGAALAGCFQVQLSRVTVRESDVAKGQLLVKFEVNPLDTKLHKTFNVIRQLSTNETNMVECLRVSLAEHLSVAAQSMEESSDRRLSMSGLAAVANALQSKTAHITGTEAVLHETPIDHTWDHIMLAFWIILLLLALLLCWCCLTAYSKGPQAVLEKLPQAEPEEMIPLQTQLRDSTSLPYPRLSVRETLHGDIARKDRIQSQPAPELWVPPPPPFVTAAGYAAPTTLTRYDDFVAMGVEELSLLPEVHGNT
uniref:SbsA Ig-like domain-containing protein n=1 Tax=Oxyrrhis marina TaxID=2969 RepID=A0A7S4GMQ5_OXYMA|mmetsp:Transcript_29556/g.75774  ORF Transcript_29556/g.75774 Transcript_29556/m.75774 type:complete len:615 (+) Transcript_29556:13-1857(+)